MEVEPNTSSLLPNEQHPPRIEEGAGFLVYVVARGTPRVHTLAGGGSGH